MSTAQITIENSKIVKYTGNFFQEASENGTFVVINGWEVTLKGDKIICHAERQYSDGPCICHREFKLADGLLGLAGGRIDERYAYFRKADFQAFLRKYGITSIKKENPNQTFSGCNARDTIAINSFDIYSDGEEEIAGVKGWGDYPETSTCWRNQEFRNVTGATWTVVVHGENQHTTSILYTNVKDVMSLASVFSSYLEEKGLKNFGATR